MHIRHRLGMALFFGITPLALGATQLTGGCTFAKVEEEEPAGTGGSRSMVMSSGGSGGQAPTGGNRTATGGAPIEIITKDAGTCIRDPGQDSCMPVCNVESHLPERLPPDILIVLDKSLSMNESPTNMARCMPPTCQSKWEQVSVAISNVVTATDTSVNWGLKYFGDDGQCGVNPGVAVPLAPTNHAAIVASINAAMPSSNTPTRLAENSAVEHLKTLKDPNPKYIVLATDGIPNCAPGGLNPTGTDDMGAIQAVADAHAAGFPTFVVGISTTGTMADTTLNSMAQKGGVPRAGTPAYFPVTSSADLEAALKTIAGSLASCDYPLAPASSTNDPGNLTIHVGGTTLAHDSTDGWEFTTPDHTAIHLYGTACNAVVKNGARVEVFYGCPGQPPVP